MSDSSRKIVVSFTIDFDGDEAQNLITRKLQSMLADAVYEFRSNRGGDYPDVHAAKYADVFSGKDLEDKRQEILLRSALAKSTHTAILGTTFRVKEKP